jgi:hypothetical protein
MTAPTTSSEDDLGALMAGSDLLTWYVVKVRDIPESSNIVEVKRSESGV